MISMVVRKQATATMWAVCLALAGICQTKDYDREDFLSNSGRDFIQFEDFESALEIYTELYTINPLNSEYVFNLGVSTFISGDKPQSLFYFLQSFNLGYKAPEVFYYMAKAYQFNYDMDNALYYLIKYKSALIEDDSEYQVKLKGAEELEQQITRAGQMLSKGLSVNVENIGEAVNSAYADYVPVTLFQDSVLIFTSRRETTGNVRQAHDGLPFENIFISTKNMEGEWQNAEPLPGFNGKGHDAVVAVNADETELYLYKGKRGGDIYISRRSASGRWSKPKPLKEINTRHWEGSVSLSADGNTLYFSSDRPGGFGESDLYVARKNAKGKWSDIQNLGHIINTPFDEDAPFIYKDGKTLFFSSKGHDSMGGYDVVSSTLQEDGEWSEIRNLGFPINTIDHDIYFQLNSQGSIGYFTSQRYSNFREQSIGEKDIFQIKRPNSSPVYFVFKGKVHNPETKEPVPAIVTLSDLDNADAADHKLATDINSGKFRYDLKFENRYHLKVEIGDKVYFSKELYFPYQPDLFESFIDIPLNDIPNYKISLKDVLHDAEEELSGKLPLANDPAPTIVLVRRVPYNDPELHALLKSGNIPVSFRKKLLHQLGGTPYLDDPEEGREIRKLFEDFPEDMEGPEVFTRMDQGQISDIRRKDIREIFNQSSSRKNSTIDSLAWENLPEWEKEVINRIVKAVVQEETNELSSVDEMYINNLEKEEWSAVTRLMAGQIKTLIESDSTSQFSEDEITEQFFRLTDSVYSQLKNRANKVEAFAKEAWGILYTSETSGFRKNQSQRIVLKGKVTHRSNGRGVSQIKLLLADDAGMLYAQVFTDEEGSVEFRNLLPGKRYHVMVDDYTIALFGRSRYVFTEVSVLQGEEDFLKFYADLSPEQKRAVDRMIGNTIKEEFYSENPIKKYEDEMEFSKLSQQEKDFINRVREYLKASKITDSAFYMHRSDAEQYNRLGPDVRNLFNRLIANECPPMDEDAIFYASLQEREKQFIDQLTAYRKARKTILDDIVLSGDDSEFWYVLGELNTRMGIQSKVQISGRISHKKTDRPGIIQVALADEFDQIVHVVDTDAFGNFEFISVLPDKKYKVLINRGENIGDLQFYSIQDLKINGSFGDFYDELSPTERRIIDRIIAVNLANESYANNRALTQRDNRNYQLMSPEEKLLFEELRKHIFADTVTVENAKLQKKVNQFYYSLSETERDFINRSIVRVHFENRMDEGPYPHAPRDRNFYDNLTENQKHFIGQMQTQRKAKRDVFAEEPVLFMEKAWVVLDSLVVHKGDVLSAQIVEKSSLEGAGEVPIMLASSGNEVLGKVTSSSSGHFDIPLGSHSGQVYVLTQVNRKLVTNGKEYLLQGVRISQNERPLEESTYFILDSLVVYFNFDSYYLTPASKNTLDMWLETYGKAGDGAILLIEGHTDRVGSDGYNRVLSKKRAMAVREYLLKSGVSVEKMEVAYYGKSRLKHPKSHDRLNRRVEIRLGSFHIK
jgi:outer membrane protein OmpA-like peptidoglycan-associated protein